MPGRNRATGQNKLGQLQRKEVQYKTAGMTEAVALATRTTGHPLGSSAWMCLLASLASYKARNMARLQPLTGRPSIVPGPRRALGFGRGGTAVLRTPALTGVHGQPVRVPAACFCQVLPGIGTSVNHGRDFRMGENLK